MAERYAGEEVERLGVDVASVRFDERGLVPAVVQQEGTGEVLMVAWMSEESLALTLETGTTWFWSRSRQELWNKGATSGNMQHVRRVLVDCDADTLLVEVDSPGPACHTGHRSCFFREMAGTAERDGE
ncbi:phosphoribosyl-AMP cyclohydrolase [Olsenella sp. An270]|uniref:phosphoribosyl-AMP cyclohydrolase n=1 Tax=Olsenella sp. An270 TaxID=1965615 RepID=UPI000B376A97|nr:phosphoribosyl-AMP cyclohydrolase [Olsenella sp. An270]OUO60717.1 phosphoribosyl-AMP cyclohydrolase [Olsenella sp. An270]